MAPKFLLPCLLVCSPLMVHAQEPSDEEVVSLNPFEVTSEPDSGYLAASSLAGTRVRGDLHDAASAISVVTPQFLRDTEGGVPHVPITLVKKADALVVQFALATTIDKADDRNAQLNSYLAAIAKSTAGTPGLRFEPREVFLAGADRKKSIIGKGGVVTSFAHFIIFADITPEMRPYQRVKQVRDLLSALKIDSVTTKLIDGPVGLYLRNPSQYRSELLAKIFEDIQTVKKGAGPEFEVQPSGLADHVRMRVCSENEIEVWLDYSFQIRSIRELEAKKK